MTDILHYSGTNEEEKKKIETEQEAWRTVNAMFESEKKEFTKALNEKDQVIIEKNQALIEKDQAINKKDQALIEKDQAINKKDQALNEKDQIIADLLKKLDEKK